MKQGDETEVKPPLTNCGHELSSRRADQGGVEGEPQRAASQVVSMQETAAEDPVGGGAKGDWKREEPLYDPRPSHRRAAHPCNSRFLRTTKVGAGWGREQCRQNQARTRVWPGDKKQMGIWGKKTWKWEGFPIVFLLISFSLLTCLYSDCFFGLSLIWERPGGGRGSCCHGPPAD